MKAFAGALAAAAGAGSRVDQIQLLLSDPSTEPLDALDRKSAVGAYDPRSRREAAE